MALAEVRPALPVVLQNLEQRRPESLVEDFPRHLPPNEPAPDVGDIRSLPRDATFARTHSREAGRRGRLWVVGDYGKPEGNHLFACFTYARTMGIPFGAKNGGRGGKQRKGKMFRGPFSTGNPRRRVRLTYSAAETNTSCGEAYPCGPRSQDRQRLPLYKPARKPSILRAQRTHSRRWARPLAHGQTAEASLRATWTPSADPGVDGWGVVRTCWLGAFPTGLDLFASA